MLFTARRLTAYGDGCKLIPVSYVAPPGESGGYTYADETDSQLTDGPIGAHNAGADLGHGPAYEWVAWYFTDPTLTFTFETNVAVTAVRIGFARHEDPAMFLPSTVTIGDVPFHLTGNELPDQRRGFLTFNLKNASIVAVGGRNRPKNHG